MDKKINRRTMLNTSLASFAGTGFAINSLEEQTLLSAMENSSDLSRKAAKEPGGDPLPQGKIKNLSISRLIMGGNLMEGFAHARDLVYASSLVKAYNTEKKILDTLELAEEHGVNTVIVTYRSFPVMRKYYNERGGKIQTICQVRPMPKNPTFEIDQAIDEGCTTIYVQGNMGDQLVRDGNVELIGKSIERIRKNGIEAGIGGHSIEVPVACEKAGLEPDYYVKTLHPDNYWSAHPRENRQPFGVIGKQHKDHNKSHNNMFDLYPEKTINFMKAVKRPWIAFKVLAAGAIHPREGFRFAYENGADFVCAGMFDFQVVEDTIIARKAIAKAKKRARSWMA